MSCGPHQGSALIVQPGGGLPPVEVAYLCRSYTGAELNAGRADNISSFEALKRRAGRFRAYLAGFALEGQAQIDMNAGSAAFDGENIYGLIRNIRLTDTMGRSYFAGDRGGSIDGRDIIFDQVMRTGTQWVADPADLGAAAGANQTRDITLVYRFGPQVPGRQDDVMYPLELFSERSDGGLRFDLMATLPGAPANTAVDAWNRLDLYAIIRWLPEDQVVHCPMSMLHVQHAAELSFSVRSRFVGAVDVGAEYSNVRWGVEDTGGIAVGAMDPVTVEHGGVTWLAGRNDPIYTVAAGLVDRDPYSRTLRPDWADPGTDYWPLITSRRETKVTEMARLPCNVTATGRGGHDDFRIQTRELAVITEQQQLAIEDCIGFSRGNAVLMPQPNNPSNTYDRSPGLLPLKVGANR